MCQPAAPFAPIAAVVVVATLLATAPVAGATGILVGQTDDPDLDPDDVVITVELRGDGSARWTIEHRYRLSDNETETAFESLRSDIERDPTPFVERFGERMETTVAEASSATGREMAVEDVTVSAERRNLPQSYGVVRYRFDWRGFAEIDGSTITAGDALGGFFLDEETRLLMTWPEDYDLESVTPPPDERRTGSVVWRGPTDFGPDEPRLVVVPGGADVSPIVDGDGYPITTVAVVLALLIAGGVLFILRRRRGGRGPSTAEERGSGGGASPVPSELLSNEERVLQLLEDRGGRIKQKHVTREFDWSDANTSQVVGKLREDGRIETFRIGRENVIVLPDADGIDDAPDAGDR